MAKYSISALLVILATLICNVVLEAPSIHYRHLPAIQEHHEYLTESNHKSVAYDRSKNYALPKNIKPENYKIELHPEFISDDKKEVFGFSGTVEIFINVIAKTKEIVLNTKNLTDEECKVYDGNSKELKIGELQWDKDVETLTIPLNVELAKDAKAKVVCTFSGTMLHDDFKGFYLSKYQDEGKTKYLGTTQFESSGARRAFPCFDEPGFKATFEVVIVHSTEYGTVISNMNSVTKAEKDPKYLRTTFEKTPIMSTYLLAFVVSSFKKYEKNSPKAPVMRVFGRNKDIIDIAAERSQIFGAASIEALEDFLGLKYSDNPEKMKLDQIGIPDFAAGAMENWGLVTYREPQFFFNPAESTSSNLKSIYCTITHEFAHQWFGNLVTPAWWNYIWLNEGFATYFEYIVTEDALKKLKGNYEELPWRTAEQFAVVNRHNAFANDGLNKTRPMSAPAETPVEVNNLFDRIAYAKAGSVLYMIEHILTTKVWKAGLKKYLSENANGIVEPKDLWDSLQAAYDEEFVKSPDTLPDLGHLNVNDIGNSWSLETGYPVVKVTKEGLEVKLEQTRFQTDYKSDIPSKWVIPINYALETTLEEDLKKTQPVEFLTQGSRTIKVAKETDFILLNNQQTAFYRVNYDDKNWFKIIDFVNKKGNLEKVLPVTQGQLIDDSLNLGRGGYLPYTTVLPLVRTILSNVTDYAPWQTAVTNLQFLDVQVQGTDAEKRYMSLNKELIAKVYKEIVNKFQVDKEKDDLPLKLNRLNVLKRACNIGLEKCLKETAEELEKTYLKPKDFKPIDPDYQAILYCGGVRNGEGEASEKTYTKLLERYGKVTTSVERQNLVRGLGCFSNKVVLNKVLDESLEEKSKFKDNAVLAWTSMIESGTTGLEVALDYFTKHYTHIKTAFDAPANITLIISSFGSRISKESYLNKLTSFEKDLVAEDKPAMEAVTKTIKEKIEWNKVYLPEIEQWLKDNNYSSASGLIINTGLLICALLVTIGLRQ